MQTETFLFQTFDRTPKHLNLFAAQAEDELVIYTNSKNSYSLRRPSDWNQVEKAGADALFKAPDLRSTDLGVTVSPVRIKHLDQLGDVNTVGGRLLAAEKKKVSPSCTHGVRNGMLIQKQHQKVAIICVEAHLRRSLKV